ncbi:MAG TPA: hypothetical protein VGA09_24115 [Candidatus Binatia bacterium]
MQAPNTQALDDHMKDMIVALQRAVGAAISHIKDDPKLVDKAIGDCKEILDVVIEGSVEEWLA